MPGERNYKFQERVGRTNLLIYAYAKLCGNVGEGDISGFGPVNLQGLQWRIPIQITNTRIVIYNIFTTDLQQIYHVITNTRFVIFK